MAKTNSVICAQLGARDHYGFPRAFLSESLLQCLITDYWSASGSIFPFGLTRRMAGRFHSDLEHTHVIGLNFSTISRRVLARGRSRWNRAMMENKGFQRDVLRQLAKLASCQPQSQRVVLFSYSYSSKDLFRFAKDHDWTTVLGQIDPGPEEERIVKQLRDRAGDWKCMRSSPPAEYYEDWSEEIELADRVIVNSDWSKKALIRAGVEKSKLAQVSIPYEGYKRYLPQKAFPLQFNSNRPLKLLFLGQVNLRKGVRELVLALDALQDRPVELMVVGDSQLVVPKRFRALRSITWIDAVPRSSVEMYYSWADVFILPTHSDGFGLTQIEALARSLPVIASINCGRVVEDNVNGRLLETVTVEEIIKVIGEILEQPECLARWSSRCQIPEESRVNVVGHQLRCVLSGFS